MQFLRISSGITLVTKYPTHTTPHIHTSIHLSVCTHALGTRASSMNHNLKGEEKRVPRDITSIKFVNKKGNCFKKTKTKKTTSNTHAHTHARIRTRTRTHMYAHIDLRFPNRAFLHLTRHDYVRCACVLLQRANVKPNKDVCQRSWRTFKRDCPEPRPYRRHG